MQCLRSGPIRRRRVTFLPLMAARCERSGLARPCSSTEIASRIAISSNDGTLRIALGRRQATEGTFWQGRSAARSHRAGMRHGKPFQKGSFDRGYRPAMSSDVQRHALAHRYASKRANWRLVGRKYLMYNVQLARGASINRSLVHLDHRSNFV